MPAFPDHQTLALCERYSLWLRQSGGMNLRGRPRPRGQESGQDFEGFAEYTPGMPVRHVDWGIYARSEQLYVRRFADQASGLLAVLVDASGSMKIGQKWPLARGLAAALTYAALRELHQVVLGVVIDGAVRVLPPLVGEDVAPAAFEFLGQVEPHGETNLGSAFGALPLGSARGDAVIISDFLDPSSPDAGLAHLRARGFQVDLCRVSQAGEFDVPPGTQALRDPESPSHRPAPNDRGALSSRVEKHRGRLVESARRYGAQLLELDADLSLAAALEQYFRRVARSRGT